VASSARESQLRIVYSLLKPAVRAAAAFRLPVRQLLDLVRLAYFEHLQRSGLSTDAVAAHFGQTPRHMRSLAQKLDSAFFDPERDTGLARDIEALVGATPQTPEQVAAALGSWSAAEVATAIEQLVADGRVERRADGTLAAAQRYVVLRDDKFPHRIDSLNHFLDAAYRAVMRRVMSDDRDLALMKTISFSATAEELRRWIARLEGDLRRDLAALDESAEFQGRGGERYTLSLGLASKTDEP
jgi:hypothetical protein